MVPVPAPHTEHKHHKSNTFRQPPPDTTDASIGFRLHAHKEFPTC